MDLKSAIMERISRRKFELDPVDGAVLEQLEAAVWECNRAAGLNIKIKLDDGEAFSGSRSKGMFSGACNYFAMICKKDDPDGDEGSDGDDDPDADEDPEKKWKPPKNQAEMEPTDSKPEMPMIGMDGRTEDGAMPYELLKRQLDFLK